MTASGEAHIVGPGEMISGVPIGTVAGRLRERSRDVGVRAAADGDRAGISSRKEYQARGDRRCRSLDLGSPGARETNCRNIQNGWREHMRFLQSEQRTALG